MSVCWKCGAAAEEHHRFCVQCGADQSRGARSPEGDASGGAGGDPLLGRTVLQKYRIEASIGAGAMGTIYRAQQVSLGKTIVIKVLHRHLMEDPELVQRFHREARAASRLNHANCVHIIDFGSLADGALFIAMEFIAGIDFADLLERAYPLEHLRVVRIARQICAALDEAHANGVLHRDLKPENIMIEDRRNAPDHVKVVDFGIAKIEDGHSRSTRAFQTRVGIVCGTPEYMSPEQARGEKLDARSDLYALGVLLFRAVTDCMPFQGDSAVETVTFHITQPIPDPRVYRPDLPQSLADLIVTLLAKGRDDRPASAMDVHAELERIERELVANPPPDPQRALVDTRTAVDLRPISMLIEAAELPLPDGRADTRPAPRASHLGPSPTAASSGLAAPVPAASSGLAAPPSAPRSALMPPPRREVPPDGTRSGGAAEAGGAARSDAAPRSALMPPPRRSPVAGPPEGSDASGNASGPRVDLRSAPTEDGHALAAADASPRRAARAQTDATLRDVGGALTAPHEAITHKELPNPERRRAEPTVQIAGTGVRRWRVAVALVVVLGAGAAAVLALV